MKKDFTNILIPFFLIGAMLVGSSYVYQKKSLAELKRNELVELQKLQEQELLARKAEEAALADVKAKEEQIRLEQEALLKAQQDIQVAQQTKAQQDALAKKQADLQILLQQQADAKLAAEKLAAQQARDAQAAAAKKSRQSRAS